MRYDKIVGVNFSAALGWADSAADDADTDGDAALWRAIEERLSGLDGDVCGKLRERARREDTQHWFSEVPGYVARGLIYVVG